MRAVRSASLRNFLSKRTRQGKEERKINSGYLDFKLLGGKAGRIKEEIVVEKLGYL